MVEESSSHLDILLSIIHLQTNRKTAYWCWGLATRYLTELLLLFAAFLIARSVKCEPARRSFTMEILICPRWLLNRLPIDGQKRKHFNAFFSVLLVCLAAPILSKIPHFCLFRYFLGAPCPGCGVTHSLIAVERMQFGDAWLSNPAGIALAIYLVLQLCGHSLALRFDRAGTTVSRLSKLGERFVLSALLVVWLVRLFHF